MEHYRSNVSSVMRFLRTEGFSASMISLHKLCYQELEAFLRIRGQPYSHEAAFQWLEANQTSWTYKRYTGYRHCVRQLDDVYSTGSIDKDHLGCRKPPYVLLTPEFKELLDSFMNDGSYATDDRFRVACARFLLYLQSHGLTTVDSLDYELLLRFHEDDHHISQRSKDVYEDLIRVFLRYLADNGRCSFGLSIALSKRLIPHIIRISGDELRACTAPDDQMISWEDILRFLSDMRETRYRATALKSSKHILSLLYIFLDMHHVGLSDSVAWYWFYKLKPHLGSNYQQHRRSLYQFLLFLETGKITTSVTGDPRKVNPVEALPEWQKTALQGYLTLLKREGWQPSTVAMQRSSNLKFCRYLTCREIRCFKDVTPEILKDFNLQDVHQTPEGKMAYNCRIRSFIIYLYEEGLVDDAYLYRALPTMTAPRTYIVKTLSKEDVAAIWAVDIDRLSAKELRDYAIVCIGLTMGFRASDILSIRFTDIDWRQRSISLTQKKTGKIITLPMPVRTGNILFRYMRDGRPKSDSPYIFIRHEVPYGGVGRSVCQNALKRFVPANKARGGGFHVVRKTFATRLLAGNVHVELISDSLGHSTDGNVHKYLSLDEKRMRMCPLSLAEAGIPYSGGAFHA